MGGILSGPEIVRQMELGNIEIEPFNPKHINPASYDLTLGKQVRFYGITRGSSFKHFLDPKAKNEYDEVELPDDGQVIRPGTLYLMHTVERVCAKNFVPIVDGKSSIGRLGILIHVTAGYGDPGYDGQYTLEVVCIHPVKLYPGMRIAQIRFTSIVGDILSYQQTGHYRGKAAQGAITSMSWKQFAEAEEQKTAECQDKEKHKDGRTTEEEGTATTVASGAPDPG